MIRHSQNLVFIIIVLSSIALVSYIFFASRDTSDAAGSLTVVEITDSYSNGVHHIEGTVPVPSTCSRILAYGDIRADTLVLSFVPKERDLGVCIDEVTLIPFKMELEAEEVKYYLAEVGGVIYPVRSK